MDPDQLREEIINRLQMVIDPETGENIMRMRLVEDILVDVSGKVTYTFRPSSPLCPIAMPLALKIIRAIGQAPGVTDQDITVLDYIQASELNEILKIIRKVY
ncbi:MAG TPA: iron-sulfur cluster assembly protein [Anaerolineaceae bacterium]|nr:iron-sulfur cluster assembly protein [Anaerolineaceae bacterium]HPN52609.1 iron-sulfur cluster assembly protein [Anaerolineaceae bacterium]